MLLVQSGAGPGEDDWKKVTLVSDIDFSFADPHSPWQHGVNENTNGRLRHHFSKGSDLSVHTEADLDVVAVKLNDRPRERLQFTKPIEAIGPLLLR